MKNKRFYISALICFMVMFTGYHPDAACQPKIGVVFGGGGAKGAAEVGVLKVLEEAGIHADYVAGTSMGAVIGGLYAAGYTAKEIERMLLNEDWLWLFDRNKIINPGDNRILGLVRGPYFRAHMDAALTAKGAHLFRHIKTPFVCVATDIRGNNFKEVDMHEGVVAEAIRVSMAYPAPGNAPVVMSGMDLADGGMVNNLPVNVVRRMGADIVIAIDLEQSSEDNFSLGIPTLGVVTKWFNVRPDRARRMKNIDNADVYIHPNLKGFSIKDYDRQHLSQMIAIGQKTAKEHYAELVKIARRAHSR
ncbi:MAG: patatin-like phospholipase family protein [Bacteroidaceae bacterium]|nr:patatin-like phospholipase family protein [Bacteroidaceae bacterium]